MACPMENPICCTLVLSSKVGPASICEYFRALRVLSRLFESLLISFVVVVDASVSVLSRLTRHRLLRSWNRPVSVPVKAQSSFFVWLSLY